MSGREYEEDASYYSMNYGAEKSILPEIPPSGAISLNLSPLDRASSVMGTSTQSMRTSSFAMSDDMSENRENRASQHPDSLRIRKAYSRPSRSRISTVENSVPEKDTTDYYDEKDFQNTDRYGFLRIQSSNCDPPEARNRAALRSENGSSRKSMRASSVDAEQPKRKNKLLGKSKDDILIPPRKADFETKMTAKEIERAKKWKDMAVMQKPNGTLQFKFPVTKKVMQRTFKGIPDCWRTTVWHTFLNTQAEKRGDRETESELIQSYHDLLEQDCDDDAQIDLDVPRTISEHIFFRQRYGAGQRLLFQILHCISLKFPSHGYVQGMAAIAATLLCYYPDDIAFVMLVRLWQDKGLKDFFSPEFDGLMTAFKSLENALKFRPEGKTLATLGIDPPSYATRWYLTLFNYSLPFHTQLRIWDALMISNDGPALLHATALALLNGLSDRLKNADFERAMKLITGRIDVKNDDRLMHLVFKEAIANGAIQM